MVAGDVVSLYERRAAEYDRDRSRSLQEWRWLDRFREHVAPAETILDVGCGSGEPIARYFVERGYEVVGIDSSPSLIALCRERFPEMEWIVGDMRRLELGRRFDGLIAWDSFFHLSTHDQRCMFPRFANHLNTGAPLMFTSGSAEGESIGRYSGEPLYHASLSTDEYRDLLTGSGFAVRAHQVDDPECGGHTVWLAQAVGR